MLIAVSERVKDLGIEILDLRFKRINYIEEDRAKVYDRMITERKRIAEKFRSEGQGEASIIRGQKERELKSITSEAFRKAEEIKGRGDAEATKIYANAYNRDPEFYQFMKTLETYRVTIDSSTSLFLTTDSEYFQYLQRVR